MGSRRGKEEEAVAIGIDLGTTYSCVAAWKNDRVEIIPNDQGNRTTPSSVAFTPADRLIGDGAKNQLSMNPTNTIFDAKRLIGRNYSDSKVQQDMKLWPFKVIQGTSDTPKIVVTYKGQKKEFMAEEISSMILGKMKETAEAYLGKVVNNAIVTVPAYFNESQRQATKNASTIAGLNIIRMINEPTAAALTYGLDNKSGEPINVLIFDLGGGTFDVSLMTIEGGGKFKVKAVCGDTHLGGEDFDNLMVDHCVWDFKRRWKMDLAGNQRALGRLRGSCEKAKRILSSTTETSIELDCLHEGIDFSMKFTRAKFENLNMSMFNSCIKTVDKCLKDARMDKSCVDEIVLVGGSTRIPMVQSMLQEYFDGKQLCKSVNPDEAVAYGAAIMAAKLSGSTCVRDLVLVDVTPLSLGYEAIGDVFSVVIPRNTPIPIKKVSYLPTARDYQQGAAVKVYQGERTRATDNHFLGEFSIFGIPPALKGVSTIWTCFDIDADGLLTVTAKILSTGNTEQLIVKNENGRLSKEEIEKMIKDADKYKHEDQEFKKRADAYRALEDYLYDLKNKIKKYDSQERVHPYSMKKIENAIDYTTTWLLENQAATVDELQHMKSNVQRFESESTRRNEETHPRRRNQETQPRRRNEETNPRPRNQETDPRRRNHETEPRRRNQETDPRRRSQETDPRRRNQETGPRRRNQETGPRRRNQETEPRRGNQETEPRRRNHETEPRRGNQKKLGSWFGGLLYGLKGNIQRRFYIFVS